MDSNKLKAACILAGIQVHADGSGCFIDIHGGGVFFYFNDPHPMLIPYVASLLVAKVAKEGMCCATEYKMALMEQASVHKNSFTVNLSLITTTDEQRIRAAVAALEVNDG